MTANEFIAAARLASAALVTALGAYDAAAQPAPPVVGKYTLVLIGDSRLNGDWNALLGRDDILNLSVAGSKASDWLADWPAYVNVIKALGVKKVVVQYGKNEIDAGRSAYETAHGIQDVVTIIQTHTTAKAGALATLPVSAATQNSTVLNARIGGLLPAIQSQMASAGPVAQYFEGYGALVSNGTLLPQYTDDGSHLNAAGREVYKNAITQFEALLP